MSKHVHEIRDPIHVFVRLDSDERAVVDSSPFQRLRHIHQLALTYLLYPAATHKRFEHSLGVMELAGQGLRRRHKSGERDGPVSQQPCRTLSNADALRIGDGSSGSPPSAMTWAICRSLTQPKRTLTRWLES